MKTILILFIFMTFPQMSEGGLILCDFSLAALSKPGKSTLENIVKSGEPYTLQDALDFAISSLPSGEIKSKFTDSVFRNVISRERKIKWKAKKPQTREEALLQTFRAIEIALEPDLQPIKRFSVYFYGRQFYLDKFLDQATSLLRVQDAVYLTSGSDIPLEAPSRLHTLFKRLQLLMINIFWLREYQNLRSIELNSDFHNMLDLKDDQGLRRLVIERHGPDISIQWFLVHIRNIQLAATVALLAVLIPEVSNAYFHEATLERLETATADQETFKEAQQILSKSDLELRDMIKKTLSTAQKGSLTPDEMNFLKDFSKTP